MEPPPIDPDMSGAGLPITQLPDFETQISIEHVPCRGVSVEHLIHPSFRLEVHEVQIKEGTSAILLVCDFAIAPEPDLRMDSAAIAPWLGGEWRRPLLLKVVPRIKIRARRAAA